MFHLIHIFMQLYHDQNQTENKDLSPILSTSFIEDVLMMSKILISVYCKKEKINDVLQMYAPSPRGSERERARESGGMQPSLNVTSVIKHFQLVQI